MNFKVLFNKQNIFYTLIFIFGLLIIVINRSIVGFNDVLCILDLATFFSILYVIFTAKHTVWGLVFDLIATFIIAFANAYQHLWLNLAVCVLVGIPNLTWGIIKWKQNEKIDKTKNLKNLSKRNLLFVFLVYFLLSVIFAIILYFLKGNLFYLDAIYSAGCAIGLVFSSRAYIDQFYLYIFADIFGITMYTMLTIQNINNISMIFTSVIFIVGNFIGLFNWRKFLKKQNDEIKNKHNVEIKQTEKEKTK